MAKSDSRTAVPKKKCMRGFASMDRAEQREIASRGGKAAHEKGTAHEFDSSEAREAGRKGGAKVSQNREHMAVIGRKGGGKAGKNRGKNIAVESNLEFPNVGTISDEDRRKFGDDMSDLAKGKE